MSWVLVHDYARAGWAPDVSAAERATAYCADLEAGAILFFPGCPFELAEDDRSTLLAHRQSGLRYHKNVSYQPLTGVVRGMAADDPAESNELRRILGAYSASAIQFVERFLTPYAGHLGIDYASYRPVEEQGRKMSLHKRNDLLHVDAFPNRPTAGGRILRVFTNLNPTQTRCWITTDSFDRLAERYAAAAGLGEVVRRGRSPLWKLAYRAARWPRQLIGRAALAPTAFDRFMHRFHNFLKENGDFQTGCPKTTHEFPPGSTWLVYTDYVPHAVLSGQFALEQTLIVRPEGMVAPERAPIRILERMCGQRLAA
jgi:hypothetical protein